MQFYKAILIVSLAVAAWNKNKGHEPFPYFLSFMAMVFILEIPVDYYIQKRDISNYPLKNLFSKLCLFYYLFVFYNINKKKVWSRKLGFTIIMFICVTLIWQFGFQARNTIDIVSYNAGYVLLIPFMLQYLYEVIYRYPYFNVFIDPYLYFIFGILIFYTSSFPILGFINLLITDNPHYIIYFDLLNIGNIFLSLAYFGAAICSTTKPPSTISS